MNTWARIGAMLAACACASAASAAPKNVILMIGDANFDGVVGLADLLVLADNYGLTGAGWRQGDLSGDGAVGIADLGILAEHYGQTGSADVPEPASAAVLMVGAAMGLLGRFRRRHFPK